MQRYRISARTLAGIVKKEKGDGWIAVFVTPKGNANRAPIGTKVGLRGGILNKIHYSHLGVSFALVRVPVATVAGKTLRQTVNIDQS
ncbi:hypothetical protein HAP94_06500 [Acidithiobacillus ferrivorans]|nr:hypothetical protein [Acidithiobacillus ferrivorans]